MSDYRNNQSSDPLPLVSVVIAFRNEADHLENCVLSLLEGDYPREKLEFILVDGDSEDDSVAVIEKLDLNPARCELLSNPKKIFFHLLIHLRIYS